MHTTILGAGAIGGVIGARLQRAGHTVTLVARGEHLRAMQADGLRLAEPEGVETLRVDARDRVPDHTDLVWLAVKSQDTADALGGVPDGCSVVSLQNGIGNERLIDAAGHPVVGAMVWLPAVHLEPGEVRLHCLAAEGRVDVGDWPVGAGDVAATARDLLRAAGFQSDLRDDIMAWKRTKLLTNLAGGLQAACGTVPEDLLRLLQAEAEAVFRALDLPYHPVADLLAHCPTTSTPLADGRTRPGGSTWQSVARGRPTEAGALYGELVRLAGDAGVDTPFCRRMINRCGALQRPAEWTIGGLRWALLEAPEGEELVLRRASLEAVRRRPGMYFGDPDDVAAPIQLLLEVLGNSLDQHLGGRCTRIDVRLVADGFRVTDDGPGVEPDRLHGYLSALHSGATADGHWPHVHPRLSFAGVGLAPVNALCRRFEWTTRFAGRATRRRYAFGQPLGPAEDLGPTTTTGLEIEAVLDRDIVTRPVDLVLVVDALERLAALSDLELTLDGYPVRADGLAGLVTRRAGCAGRLGFRPADVQVRRRHGDVSVDLAMFVDQYDDRQMGWSFINFSETLGGTHVDGLRRAVKASRFRRHGLLFGLHVLLEGPRFRAPTRDWLDNREAEVAVHAVVTEALAELRR